MSLRNKIALWTVIIVVLGAAVSVQWIHPAYRNVKMWYFLNQAEGFLEKKDYSAASVAYHTALQCGYDRPEAWKSLAKFLEQVDSPEIIGVWERLAIMEPNVREYRFKQAAAAIKYGRGYEAQDILDKVPEGWRDAPDYLRSIADIAIQKNQSEVAEQVLERLLREHPNDEKIAFDLELTRAKNTDLAKQMKALRKLEEIGQSSSKFASTALRKLVEVASGKKDYVEADRLAAKLISLPDATIRDRLLYLQLELTSQSLSTPSSIQNLRTYVEKHPKDLELMVDWMVSNKIDPEGTAEWIRSLSPDFTSLPEVQSGLLPFYLNTANFKEIFRILRARRESLGLRGNVFEYAEKAINQRDTEPSNAERTWMEAIYAAEGNPQSLYYLSLIAKAKGWMSATGRALSSLADNASDKIEVWNLLAGHESSVGNLPGYYKALSGLMRINPDDVGVSSSWVIASVLLNRGETKEILNVAKRAYDVEPEDSRVGTAYAMALLRDDQPQQALSVIYRMSEENRRLPQRAIYLGAIFAANGHQKEAFEYFERSEKLADHNFPEELALRRIWKGVALGETTATQEQKRLLTAGKELQAESEKMRIEFQRQFEMRNPNSTAEVQHILDPLKVTDSTSRKISPEAERLLRDFRDSEEKSKSVHP